MRICNFIKLSMALVAILVFSSCEMLSNPEWGKPKVRVELDVTCDGLGLDNALFTAGWAPTYSLGFSDPYFYSYLRDDGYEFSFEREIPSPDDPNSSLMLVIKANLEEEFELNRKYYFATSSGWEHYVSISVAYIENSGDYCHSISGNPIHGPSCYYFDTVGGYLRVIDRRDGNNGREIWSFEIVFKGDNVDGEEVWECSDDSGAYYRTYYPELSKGRMTIEGTFFDHKIDC